MKHLLMLMLALAALALAGCAGDVLSSADSHNVTTTTTAELSQDDSRPVCVGLFVVGSCNTTAAIAHGAPAQTAAVNLTWADVGRWLLIAAMITFLFVMLWTGINWIFGGDTATE